MADIWNENVILGIDTQARPGCLECTEGWNSKSPPRSGQYQGNLPFVNIFVLFFIVMKT